MEKLYSIALEIMIIVNFDIYELQLSLFTYPFAGYLLMKILCIISLNLSKRRPFFKYLYTNVLKLLIVVQFCLVVAKWEGSISISWS